MKNCKKCGLVKIWKGLDMICPFKDDGLFELNWNCGIINQIRKLSELHGNYRINYQYCDDQKYCSINIDDVDIDGICLWVSWYKNRGSTDAMFILSDCEPPRKPNYDDLKLIVDLFNK